MACKQGIQIAVSPPEGYIAIGSNLRTATRTSLEIVVEALGLLAPAGLRITSESRWYSAPAFPKGNGPDYVNGVVGFSTGLDAAAVLAALHEIEHSLGRTRLKRWAARPVDLDLLAFGAEIRPSRAVFERWRGLPLAAQMQAAPDTLILPHPRLQDRAFVLKPWADIAPDWQHPILGQTVREMLAALPAADRDEICLL